MFCFQSQGLSCLKELGLCSYDDLEVTSCGLVTSREQVESMTLELRYTRIPELDSLSSPSLWTADLYLHYVHLSPGCKGQMYLIPEWQLHPSGANMGQGK